MFFRPSGQMRTREKPLEGNLETIQVKDMPLPQGKPILALLDGLPLVNHDLLKERLIIDDPDNFEKNYLSKDRIHGTAMASLIIHGDLNREQLPLNRPIYVRPILKPEKNLNNNTNEIVPKDYLIVDLIHRAVKRIFEGEGEEDPVAPTVKIINFSVGDSSRQFTQTISPLARLLDWLSVKYNVLFIVSAGNYDSDISLGISQDEFESLKKDKLKLEKKIIEFLYKDIRNRRLLSPAETINGLSIGALHFDYTKEYVQANRIDPYKNLLPSPISAFGSGYRRAVKPDFIYFGGRQLYNGLIRSLKPVCSLNPPGNKSASPSSSSGEFNATSYSCGTSNATALTSRAAVLCYETLQEIFYEQAQEQDFSNYEVPLVKAMLVHSCSWGEVGSKLEEILQDTNSTKIRDSKRQIRRWIGYGIANFERVLSCTKNRVTLLGFGELSEEKAHVFSLPLPPSLNSQAILRRLIVTLAWLSPISPKTQKYRIAHLWFEINGTPLAANRKECSAGKDGRSAVRRGTVQHEIFEGQNAEVFSDEDKIQIKVNCRSETEKLQKLIPYGLVVSLEVEEGLFVSIYQEIREKIQPKIKVPQRV